MYSYIFLRMHYNILVYLGIIIIYSEFARKYTKYIFSVVFNCYIILF